MNKKVLLLDDDVLHRTFMIQLIKEYFDKEVDIIELVSGDGVYKLLKEMNSTPDLCILDMWVPGLKGIEVALKIWTENVNTPILFWSQHSEEMYVRKLFSMIPQDAIYGYLVKGVDKQVVFSAIECVMNQEQCWIDPQIGGEKLMSSSKEKLLTHLEFETLMDLALGLSDNAIANRRFITKRGIQNRLASLYSKLGISDEQFANAEWGSVFSLRTRAVSLAINSGLITLEALKQEHENLKSWLRKMS